MRPNLIDFGGFANLNEYKAWFEDVYLKEPLYDVRGKQVVFGHEKLNGPDDWLHAIYGTPRSKWGSKEDWNPKRAERLPWIKAALSDAKVKIHLSEDGVYPKSESHVYLWVADSGDACVADEYYMVVTIDGKIFGLNNSVMFYTAYGLELSEFRNRKARYRCIWPEPVSNKTKRTKKGKGSPR